MNGALCSAVVYLYGMFIGSHIAKADRSGFKILYPMYILLLGSYKVKSSGLHYYLDATIKIDAGNSILVF